MLEPDIATAEDAVARLREFVTDKSGLEFPPSRRPQLDAAVARSVRELGLRDARELLEHLRDEDGLADLEDLIAAVTIGETYFFRDEAQLQTLEQHVLPDLIERHASSKRLRLWSAGCSTGEEPYSLAMLLDRLVPDIAQWDILIVGTDIDRHALNTASGGIYRPWSLRRTPGEVRDRYFTAHDGGWQLDARIRRMVDFRYLNLVADLYPSLLSNIHAMDLIVCRNVLIYFGSNTAHAVLAKLSSAVAEAGWLVVGHAEVMPNDLRDLAPRRFAGAVLYQKTKPVERKADRPSSAAVPAGSRLDPSPAQPAPARSAAARQQVVPQRARRRAEDIIPGLIREATQRTQDPRPAYALAKLLADRGDTSEAQHWIAEALDRDPLFAPAHLVAALMAEEDGRLDAAIRGFRRCIYAQPNWPLPYVALARCFTKAGNTERSRAALANAVRLLETSKPDEPVAEGDGITAGRLLELTRIQSGISGTSMGSEAADGH